MNNNEEEDMKVIKFSENNDNNQNKISEVEKNVDKDNNATEVPKKKKQKLRVQRTKAPKVYLKEQEKEKKGLTGLFSCCLPFNKDDDDND